MTKSVQEILDEHDVIAWDIDGTLIERDENYNIVYNHISSDLRQYIIDNPKKTHHIVTFRNDSWANIVFDELVECGMDRNCRVYFTSLNNCPSQLHDAFQLRNVKRELADHYGFSQSTIKHAVENFPLWKGLTASILGATVLVDDMADWVSAGCEKHGVDFLDVKNMSYHRNRK